MGPRDIEALSADKRALLERMLRGFPLSNSPSPLSIRPFARDRAPLSPAQEQLWYFTRLAPGNPVYNEAVSIRKDGPFNVDAFRAAFNELVRRHEIWRTTFRELDGEPWQVIHPAPLLELPIADLSALPAAHREREAVRMAAEEARAPYDLAHGPLLRPLLIRFAEDHHRLYLCLHHLIFDGVSLYRIVLPELAALYEDFAAGHEPSLPEPPIQYSDYSWALRDQEGGPDYARRVDYWRERLSDAPTLPLPRDHPRPAHQRFQGGMRRVRMSAELTRELRSLGEACGATLFQVLASAFTVLVDRYSGLEDIVFSTLTDLRDSPELEQMVGYCLTPLVVRVDVEGEPSFVELLRRVRAELLDGLSSLVPFERLVRELRPRREPGANPLFQVALVLEPAAVPVDPAWSLHQMEADVGDAIGNAKFDLMLELDERPEGHIDGRLIYDTDLFEPETAMRIVGHWIAVLEGIVAAPSRPVAELPVLTEAERHRQLVEWNATSAEYPRDACVHELVATQAGRVPDAVAAVFGDEQLTYRELDERAERLARRLAARNPGRGLIAIHLERSLEMLVGMLAILKSGAAYLPLDPDHPRERLSSMLADSGAALLLTHSRLLSAVPEHAPEVVCIDPDRPESEHGAEEAPLPSASAEDLAYVLYTSGSTGTPKGVCISHRSVVNFLAAAAREPGVGADDTLVAVTTYAFDIAVTELWLPLVSGGRVVIAAREVAADPRRLASLIERTETTVMQATPATWQMLIDAGWRGRPGLTAVSIGDSLTPRLAASLLDRTACLWNMYGPTETTVWSTGERVQRGAPITIGRPIANTRTYILSRGLQPAPVGVPGELAIAGDGVGVGYLNSPELTSERFVPDPFAQGGRVYLTGDLARYRPDGRIEHLGRLDRQIKVRGFRVEPGEVEAALIAAPDIAAAVVDARGDRLEHKRLVAYVVPAGAPPSPSDLRERLRAELPAYMVPSVFVTLDALPVSANGKIDRGALPEPDAIQEPCEVSAAPRSDDEQRMAAIWARVLGLDRVGIYDDFFDLGGHSLLALRLLREVARELHVKLPLDAFFERDDVTVASLAARVQAARGRTKTTGAAAGQAILFFITPDRPSALTARHFTGPLGSEFRLLGLVPEWVEGRFAPGQGIEGLARPLVDQVSAAQRHGPYYLVGLSTGGLLAYEIAGRLRAGGEQVAWLGLLDTASPAVDAKWRSLRERAAHQWRAGPRSMLAKLNAASLLRAVDNDRLVRHYAPRPHDAALDVFATGPSVAMAGSERLGWEEVHAGPVRVHRIGGDHDSMVGEGHVEALAELVSACVKEARDSSILRPSRH